MPDPADVTLILFGESNGAVLWQENYHSDRSAETFCKGSATGQIVPHATCIRLGPDLAFAAHDVLENRQLFSADRATRM